MTFFLRLLGTAIGAVTLYAQNPLAVAADPFGGTFQNEQMKLELARKGQEYTGMILLGGQSLPVKAKATAGTLAGTFESQGQSYSFQAKRSGSQLTLTTDGATHVLDRAGTAVAAVAVTPPSVVVGEWRSPNSVVRVNADGTATIGAKSHRWTVDGNVITFSGDGEPIRLPFEMAGNTWTWKFPDRQLVLTRVVAGASPISTGGILGQWQGPNGVAQFNPDGTATVGGLVYRYSQTGDQLTLQGADGTFTATVRIEAETMSWVVNGKTLGFQRATTTGAPGGIMVELVGKWCQATNLNNSSGSYSRSACITLLANGSFKYASDFGATGQVAGGAYGTSSDSNDAGTWTATPTSISSNSKKTGVRTFRLEKRNHAKTGDPMIVLDGAEFTTAFLKAPWR